MSREQWIQDAKERILKNAKATDAVEKELIYAYEQAAYEIEGKISAMYGRYAKDNKLSLSEADKLISGQEYTHWKKSIEQYVTEAKTDSKTLLELNTLSAKSRISRQEQLLSQIYMEMGKLAGETEAKMSGLLQGIVTSNYRQECYSLQKGMGVGFRVAGLNQELIKSIVSHPWSGKRFSERVWENTDKLAVMAKREITLGMIKGSSVQEMAKGINDVMGKGRYAAQRLVRTESSHFANEAQQMAYEECGIKRYEFLGGGCDLCQELSGCDFALEDAQEGINYPPIHPNCKCTTIAKFDKSMFDFKDGEPFEEDLSQKDWEKQYVSEDVKMALSQKEEGAIIRYTSPDSIVLNDKLRREGYSALTASEKEWIMNLDNALEKLPNYEGNVCRSVHFEYPFQVNDFVQRFQMDENVSFPEYISTSKTQVHNPEGQVQIYINSKTGKDLGRHNAQEGEVLYQRDTSFVVRNVVKKDKYYILLEEE